jgi:hypothetical protein
MKSTTTREMRISVLISAIIALAACSPQATQNENSGQNQATAEQSTVAAAARPRSGRAIDSFHLPRDLEMELASSALPPHLREQATIYVLNPARGFEIAWQGTNGFHAFVTRTGDDAMRGAWPLTAYPTDILYPVSFDAAGAKAHMRVFFDIAAMQAKGTPAVELKKAIQERYRSGYYKPPERAGLSYMLSPILRTYDNPDEGDRVSTGSMPHVMHYAPNISSEDIGGVKPEVGPYPMITVQGPHGFAVQHLGTREAEAIAKEYAPMLKRLCELNPVWCLPKSTNGHSM